ncbi:MAG: DJ-1/PfpI family protein [Bryobacteraceae bacterium]|nr:DJ-1/PfpI family protein [Bryobacteraceae bacterium]
MNRRTFFPALAGASAALQGLAATSTARLTPPAGGSIPVAFLLGPGATMIDFAGPWEVFQDVQRPGSEAAHRMAFQLYTVSDRTEPLRASAGMRIVPDHDFGSAPPPKVIVIPAQGGHTPAKIEWLRHASQKAEVTMSVCTGAFLLAKTGLLDGKLATTHHDFFDRFAGEFPRVKLRRGLRFVENGDLCSAGGLTSGIDLAIRVVDRYFGRAVAQTTVDYMEYQSKAWIRD